MKLRWLVRRRKITVDMINEYREKYSVSMITAKQELEQENTARTLQYSDNNEIWLDVDYVVEYFE